MYYFSYGVNCHPEHMATLCPGAKNLSSVQLLDTKLVFNYHCNIVEHKSSCVHGLLWDITEQHLAALDDYEGYPSYYQREYKEVYDPSTSSFKLALVYYIPNTGIYPPSSGYYLRVLNGYKLTGLSTESLILALEETTKCT